MFKVYKAAQRYYRVAPGIAKVNKKEKQYAISSTGAGGNIFLKTQKSHGKLY
jgi:hypothetical protein